MRDFYNGRSRCVENNAYYRRERSRRDDDVKCQGDRSRKYQIDAFRQEFQELEKNLMCLFKCYEKKIDHKKRRRKKCK